MGELGTMMSRVRHMCMEGDMRDPMTPHCVLPYNKRVYTVKYMTAGAASMRCVMRNGPMPAIGTPTVENLLIEEHVESYGMCDTLGLRVVRQIAIDGLETPRLPHVL